MNNWEMQCVFCQEEAFETWTTCAALAIGLHEIDPYRFAGLSMTRHSKLCFGCDRGIATYGKFVMRRVDCNKNQKPTEEEVQSKKK